jgi:hypothetical protein
LSKPSPVSLSAATVAAQNASISSGDVDEDAELVPAQPVGAAERFDDNGRARRQAVRAGRRRRVAERVVVELKPSRS